MREFFILLKGECVVQREAEPKQKGEDGRVRGPREGTRL